MVKGNMFEFPSDREENDHWTWMDGGNWVEEEMGREQGWIMYETSVRKAKEKGPGE